MKNQRTNIFLLMVLFSMNALNAQGSFPNGVVGMVRGWDWVLGFGGANRNMGATGGIQYVSKFINLNASYSLLSIYSDEIKTNSADVIGTPISATNVLEGGIQLNFYNWRGSFELEHRTDRPAPPGFYWATIERVPTTNFIGIRGGYYQWRTGVSSAMNSPNDLIAADGTVLGSVVDVFTNMKVTAFYGGLGYSYFTPESHVYVTWFGDVFFSPKTQFEPIIQNGKSYDIQAPGSKGFQTRSIGFRIGFDGFFEWFSGRGEFGARPGAGGAYMLVGVGVAFPYWWFGD